MTPQPLGYPIDLVLFFGIAFAGSLVVDLFQHRRGGDVSVRGAAAWSVFWIALAMSFAYWIHRFHGPANAELFLAGYVLEESLSVDNLMVFIAVFRFFRVRSGLQHRILYYGILGAILFRAIFVGLGAGLLKVMGPWAELVFGVLVGLAAWKMAVGDEDEGEEEQPRFLEMPLVRFFQLFYPVYPKLVGQRFFVGPAEAQEAAKQDGIPLVQSHTPATPGRVLGFLAALTAELCGGLFTSKAMRVLSFGLLPAVGEKLSGWGAQKQARLNESAAGKGRPVTRWMTPAFVCLLVVEGSDVLFSFDSVPAVIAVTQEPLLVYTATIFAVLGLRSLYFILLELTRYLAYLERAVVVILYFIAFKMLYGAAVHLTHVEAPFEITPKISLYVVLSLLGLGIAASLVFPKPTEAPEAPEAE
jgi:tellurite resistance protein TerC